MGEKQHGLSVQNERSKQRQPESTLNQLIKAPSRLCNMKDWHSGVIQHSCYISLLPTASCYFFSIFHSRDVQVI